jgi:pyridoxal phosphate enzyme (YggS family)
MYRERLAEKLPRLRDRIAGAAVAAGRSPDAVRLVAVTKAHPLEALEAALDAGLRDLGENRVEELEHKVTALGRDRAVWHMIGHIQGRKAARAVGLAHMIHSVDSVRLAQRLSRTAVERSLEVPVLAQVNTSGEESKSGLAFASAVEEVHRMAELPGLDVGGLMTMAPFVDDEAVLSAAFGCLRETLEAVRAVAPGVGAELSMGMTNDLEIAIREGSTVVRIGTALFGERVR